MSKKTVNTFVAIALPALIILAGSLYFLGFRKELPAKTANLFSANPKTGNLKSFFNSKNDYEMAFSHNQEIGKKDIIAGVISHHFLAKDLIAQFYSGIANNSIENVIVIGPDHFGVFTGSDADAFTTELNWDTPFGKLESNSDLIREILLGKNVELNDNVFKNEHSIYTEVPFIKKVFPQAKITPLIIRNTKDYGKFIKIGENLKNISSSKTILIVSSDFSHEVSSGEAKKYDGLSIANLQNLTADSFNRINCDCRACMAVLLGFLDRNFKNNFYLVGNKNSSDLGSPQDKVTSYVSGYYLGNGKNGKNSKILFLGDLMFDRYIGQASEKYGGKFLFQKAENLLKDNDLTVGNLEGPITDNPSVSVNSKMGEEKNYVFTFDPKIAEIIANENIKLVNLGNNHIRDFGISGIDKTHEHLYAAGIDFFGDPQKRLAVKRMNGLKIAFVNYNQFAADGKQKTLEDIGNAKKSGADLILLYAHWGTEFAKQPSEKIKNLAHEFIDSGVDLIIGSHPHVIQPKEKYNGKLIYYSLGNFIFDQYFDPKTQEGLTVQVEINSMDKKIDTKEYFVEMKNNGQTAQK